MPRIDVLPTVPTLGDDDVVAVPGRRRAEPSRLADRRPPRRRYPDLLESARQPATRAAGNITSLPIPARRRGAFAVRIGAGRSRTCALRWPAPSGVGNPRRAQATQPVLPVDGPIRRGADEIRAAVEAALLAGYRFRDTSTPHPPRLDDGHGRRRRRRRPRGDRRRPRRPDHRRGRRLGPRPGQHPGNVKNPAWLADAGPTGWPACRTSPSPCSARRSCRRRLRRRARRRRRLGQPAAGRRRSYRPPDAGPGHPVLVGKGITFDTGGISIKTNAGMREMKTDMAGGAAVLAAVDAGARLELPVAVTAVVPVAENAVSGASYRPGDVVRHVGGRTDGGAQHRRRGPPGAGRRASPTPGSSWAPPCSSTSRRSPVR